MIADARLMHEELSIAPVVVCLALRVRYAVLLAVTLLATAAPCFAKSLRWPSMDVTARLEANGDLRVKELLVYQFDGDWNGGERSWNLRPGQSVTIQSIHRIDP